MFEKKSVQITKNLNIDNKNEKGSSLPAAALDILISYILLLLFTCGCAMIYDSVFPIGSSKAGLFFHIAIAEAALFLAYHLPVLKKSAPLLAAGGFLAGLFIVRKSVIPGLKLCINEYLLPFNIYYGSDLAGFPDAGSAVNRMAAINVITLLLLCFFTDNLLRRKKILPLFPAPLLLVCMELFIGEAPQELPILMVVAGGMGLLPYRSGRYIKNYGKGSCLRGKSALILSASLTLCFLLASVFGKEKALSLAAMQDQGLAYQHALEQQVMEYAATGFSMRTPGRVSNRAPQYEEKPVMSVSAVNIPQENLYLRGYVGDTYQNGNWTNQSRAAFPDAMSALSESDQQNAGAYILNLFYQTQTAADFPWQYVMPQEIYRLEYFDLEDDYAYLPYLSDSDHVTNKDELTFSLPVTADATVSRMGEDSLDIIKIVPRQFLSYARKVSSYDYNTAIEDCYEEYLSLYLSVPDKLKQIKELGDKLSETAKEYETEYIDSEPLIFTKEIRSAYLVREELFANTSYSLSLDSVPFGKDVTEYFLFDSGMGFCEHYASAGALLLREMGVPARYVTGYLVKPGDFLWSAQNKCYTAVVKDSAAHAWVEIYINKVGWVPMEMTKGTAGNFSVFEDAQGGSLSADMLHETTAKNSDSSRSETINDTETPNTAATGTASAQKNQAKKDIGKNNSEQKGSFLPILLWIIGIGIFAEIVCFFCYYLLERRQAAIFAQKDCRKAIWGITSYTNRLLRKKGILKQSGLDDKAYRQTLKKALPMIPEAELTAYFSALERAAFSNETMTKADVESCRNIYQKVKTLK